MVVRVLARRRAGGAARTRSTRTANLRDTLDLDSVDFLNFVVGLHAALGVDIPEADYDKLASLDACVAYLAAQRGE